MIAALAAVAWLAAQAAAPDNPVPAPDETAGRDPRAAALDDATNRIQKGALQAPQLVDAWADKANAYAQLGDVDKAARAFSVVLRVDPSHRLPPDPAPAVQQAFAAALAAMPAPDRALAAVALRGEDGRVVVRLLADDLGLVQAARADPGAGAGSTRAPLSTAAPVQELPSSPAGARVALLDKHGNALRVLDVVDVGPATAPTSSGEGPRWLSIAGASTMAVGTAAVLTTGLFYSATGTDEGQRPLWLAGTGIATGVILLGGGLVVADLMLKD